VAAVVGDLSLVEWLTEPAWRVWPALVVAAAGGLLTARAFRRWRLRRGGHRSSLEWMLAFRGTFFGLGIAGIGIAWFGHWPVLFWAAFVIGLEETIESSFAVAALKQERDLEERAEKFRPVS
jgi:hypothetical protein